MHCTPEILHQILCAPAKSTSKSSRASRFLTLFAALFLSGLFLSVLLLSPPVLAAQQKATDSPPPSDPTPASSAAPTSPGTTSATTDFRSQPTGPLTLRDRFILQARQTFSPHSFALPAVEAGIVMARPPTRYPNDWTDGGGAFGRIYGAEVGRHTTAGLTHFAAAAILHEDPRYYPCTHTNPAARAIHALAFTLVDRSNAGHPTFAAGNFAGSLAGGFIGMAWQPDGFNDLTHAYQRSALEISTFAAHNLFVEFAPEITRLRTRLRLHLASPD